MSWLLVYHISTLLVLGIRICLAVVRRFVPLAKEREIGDGLSPDMVSAQRLRTHGEDDEEGERHDHYRSESMCAGDDRPWTYE